MQTWQQLLGQVLFLSEKSLLLVPRVFARRLPACFLEIHMPVPTPGMAWVTGWALGVAPAPVDKGTVDLLTQSELLPGRRGPGCG